MVILQHMNKNLKIQIIVNNIKIGMLLLILISSSCQSQVHKFVDLERITSDFNFGDFFQNKLKKTEEILATKVEHLDKKKAMDLLDNPFFVKDTLGFYKSEGRFPTELYLGTVSDWMSRNKKPTEIFGYEYRTVAYSEDKDTLATLNNVAFPKLNAVENKSGDLMYLKADKSSKKQSDYVKIKGYLEKNCKKLDIDGDENTSYWQNEKFFYTLTKTDRKEGDVDVTDISLSIYEKSYVQKMEELKIYSAGNVFWKKPAF